MKYDTMKISAALEVLSAPARTETQAKAVPAGKPVRLAAQGKTLSCVEGVLWVTQEGKLEDILLEAGRSVKLAPRGSVVVSSFGSGSFALA